jgi:ribosomal protein S21
MVMTVRSESVEDTLKRLRTYVSRFERRYECRSQVMAEAVSSKQVRETAEIGRWLTTYHVLKDLERRSGRTRGTPMTTT